MEWSLAGVMVLLCAGMTALQYRWTGDLAKAETARIAATLAQQVPRLATEFDSILETNAEALQPEGDLVAAQGWQAACAATLHRWNQNPKARPLFRRVLAVVPKDDDLELFELGLSGNARPAVWPGEWSALHANLLTMYRRQGFPRRMIEGVTPVLEFPIFQEGGKEHRELLWILLELDTSYLQNQLLPALTKQYLNPGPDAEYDVRLNATAGQPDANATVLNFERRNESEGRWNMSVYRRGGSLDRAIAAARWRNFAASGFLIILMGLAGFALLHYTRSSRRLAEMQFQFVAGVSHEFRTPLTVIRGAAITYCTAW